MLRTRSDVKYGIARRRRKTSGVDSLCEERSSSDSDLLKKSARWIADATIPSMPQPARSIAVMWPRFIGNIWKMSSAFSFAGSSSNCFTPRRLIVVSSGSFCSALISSVCTGRESLSSAKHSSSGGTLFASSSDGFSCLRKRGRGTSAAIRLVSIRSRARAHLSQHPAYSWLPRAGAAQGAPGGAVTWRKIGKNFLSRHARGA